MAGPLSVDDIVAQQKAEREAAAKPKFLSKAQRAALALEKRNAEVKEQQAREEDERRQRMEYEQKVEEERRRTEAARYGQGDGQGQGSGRGGQNGYGNGQGGPGNGQANGYYGRQAYNERFPNAQGNGRPGVNGSYQDAPPQPNGNAYPRSVPTGPRGQGPPSGPRAMQQQQQQHQSSPQNHLPPPPPQYGGQALPRTPYAPSPLASSSSPAGSPKPTQPNDAAPPTDSELSVIRARYLGQKTDNKKPRLRKIADKKAIFDWSATDDTTAIEQGTWSGELKGQGARGVMLGGRTVGYGEKVQPGPNEKLFADDLERRRAGRGNADERHWSDKPLEDMRDRDWRIFREDYEIAARGGSIPVPLRSWVESSIPPGILEIIDEVGYKEPSPIQRQAIPIGMQNRDLIGIAKTGSGKTAAFVIPMLAYISHLPPITEDNKHLGPYALILAPTRELAQQIDSETAKFASRMGYRSLSIIGGRAVEEQQFQLERGAHIIIATPGRLKDMIDKSLLVMSQCRYVVMDEADRMVDLGFEADLNLILDSMPATFAKPETMELDANAQDFTGMRVTTLFSATMPPAVQRLALKYLRKPATVTIGTAGEAVDTVEQRIEFVQGEDKRKSRLIELLRSIGLPPPFIVFANTKAATEVVLKYVHQAGYSGTTLHSNKSQAQREEALQAFRDREYDVLVATDVAGRGIDVEDVSLVINYNMADTIEKYVHRIGRTGRAGKTGVAITFLSNDDDEVMFDLKNEIAKSKMSTMNPELARHEAARQRVTREMKRKRDDQPEEE